MTVVAQISVPAIAAWFDGVCEPRNPGGHAAYGAVVKLHGKIVLREGGYVGHGPAMSNNVAEYAGILAVLKTIQGLPGGGTIYGDSKLVVMQLTGQWRAKSGIYLPWYRQAEILYQTLQSRIAITWVPRDQNAECDDLSKSVLREKGIKFHLQPE